MSLRRISSGGNYLEVEIAGGSFSVCARGCEPGVVEGVIRA